MLPLVECQIAPDQTAALDDQVVSVPQPRGLVPQLALASRVPSGLKARARTRPAWGSRARGRRSIARPPISAIRPSKVGARLSDPRASSVLRGKLASDTARAALALAARPLALARASCALASRRAMVARVVCASACLRLAGTRRPVAEMAPLRRRPPGSMRGAIAPTEIRRRLRAHGLIALGLGSLLLAAVLLLIWVFKLFNHDSGIRDGAGIGRKCSLLARGPGFRCGVGQVVAGGSKSTAHL